MALNSANVFIAKTGAVSVGPVGTTAPTSASSVLVAGFVDLGYLSEEGPPAENRDRSTNTIRAWQNGDDLATVVTEASHTEKFTMVETKKATVELFYGNTVTDATGAIPIVPSKTGGRKAFVIDRIMGTRRVRTYIPEGEVTETGQQAGENGEAIPYEVTISAYPTPAILDADGNNASAMKWYSDLIVTP